MTTSRIRFAGNSGDWAFEADIPVEGGMLDGDAMYKAVRKRKVLGSKGIDFTENGLIVVGIFRPVGTWAVVDAPVEARS